jgi:hypothetical protein
MTLQTQMLAEIYEAKLVDFLGNDNTEVFVVSLLELYQQFVDKKFSVYLTEKMGISKTKDSKMLSESLKLQFENQFCSFAAMKLMPSIDSISKKPTKVLLNMCNCNRSVKQTKAFFRKEAAFKFEGNEILKIGIVQRFEHVDQIEFIHRTFAEYYFATYVWKTENVGLKRFLFWKLLQDKSYNIVLTFLSELMSKYGSAEFDFYEMSWNRWYKDTQRTIISNAISNMIKN